MVGSDLVKAVVWRYGSSIQQHMIVVSTRLGIIKTQCTSDLNKYCAVSNKNEWMLVCNTRRNNLLKMRCIPYASRDELTYLNVPGLARVFVP